jgi:hypothetical protein
MSILRAPQLNTKFTNNYEEDMRKLNLEYLEASTKMMNEFMIAFAVIGVIGFILAIILLIWRG